jgi:hypothetical protein
MQKNKKADPFYLSAAWRAVRQQALERDHFYCQQCLKLVEMGVKLRPNDATLVHHVKPRSLRPDLELDLDNLVSLCDACHNAEHPERGFGPKRKKKPESPRRCVVIGNDRSMDREEYDAGNHDQHRAAAESSGRARGGSQPPDV